MLLFGFIVTDVSLAMANTSFPCPVYHQLKLTKWAGPLLPLAVGLTAPWELQGQPLEVPA